MKNLDALLEKWQPGAQHKDQSKPEVPDSGTFDLDAIPHLNEDSQMQPPSAGARPAVPDLREELKENENLPKPPPVENSQQSFDLDDKDIMDFFNRIEANKDDAPAPAAAEVPMVAAPAAPTEVENFIPEKFPDEPMISDEPVDIALEKAEFVLTGGGVEIPDEATGDILQKLPTPTKESVKYESIHSEWTKPFPWDQEVTQANNIVFGHEGFKENQLEVINASKSGRDVLAVMPTGSGKSLTFQICALTDEGVTFVVMPLLSLTLDQITYLKFVGVETIFFKSGMDTSFLKEQLLRPGSQVKLVYLTPEKLAQTSSLSTLLTELYQSHKLARFVIDEAHCISQWGREFRPDYLHLSTLKVQFPAVPILALTATATTAVREDICARLEMISPVVIQGKFGRENLFFEVRQKSRNVIDDIGAFIKREHPTDCGIIYCGSKKECEHISKILKTNYKLSCDFYHGGMTEPDRKAAQQKWMDEKVKLVVATTAFGLGINKPNVRYVIHYCMPKSMEHYVQECGRAGRDGLPSHCLVYYDMSDKRLHEFLLMQGKEQHESTKVIQYGQANIHKMLDYCEEQYICRKQMQAEYFDEPFTPGTDCKDMCDNCKARKGRGVTQTFQKEAKLMLDLVRDVLRRRKNITLLQAADYLHGKNKKKLEGIESASMAKFYGALKLISLNRIKALFIKLLVNKVLREDMCQFKQNVLTYLGLGKNEKKFDTDALTIKLMVGKEEQQPAKKEFKVPAAPAPAQPGAAPSRVYIPTKQKAGAEPMMPMAAAGFARGASAKPIGAAADVKTKKELAELKAKLKDSDVEDILDRLIYVKNRLMLRNKDDERTISEIFTVQNIMAISQTVPKDLNELRLLVETRKWSSEEERAFVKYGSYFIQEMTHYLKTYVSTVAEPEELAAVGDPAHEHSEYSIKDYEPFAALLEDDIAGEEEKMPEGGSKRKYGEGFRPASGIEAAKPNNNKRYKKGDEFL